MPRFKSFASVLFLAVSLVFASAVAFALPALAADEAAYTIDLAPVALLVIAAIAAAIGLAVRTGIHALIVYLAERAGLELDEKTRTYLDAALDNALAWGTRNLTDYAAGKIPDIETKNKVLADAANYLAERVPDALDHFDLMPDDIEKMLEARLLKKSA